jgi:Cytochrome P460
MQENIKFIRQKMRRFILFILAASIVGLNTIWSYASTPMNSLATLPQPSIDVSDLSDRTKWYKVNQIPYLISSQVNVLCAAPNPTGTSQNPHDRSAITVYVNNLGIKAMMSPKSILFPTGSVIVKKKVDPRSLDDAVLLYTVMIKNQLAFNPKAGGWEFATISGKPPQIQSRGDLASCMECHIQQKQNDYVFRTYR